MPAVLRTTQLPLPAAALSHDGDSIYAQPRHDAAYWAAKTEGMDFAAEDRLDMRRFNRILWAGLIGEAVPFPENPNPRNLRHHRSRLLRSFPKRKFSESSSAANPQ